MDGSPKYIIQQIRRKLLVMEGLVAHIKPRNLQIRILEQIMEIEDTDLPELEKFIKDKCKN